MTSSPNGSNDVDKVSLYGEYLASRRWKTNLHKKAAHKALDIDDDDDLNITTTKTGIGARGVAGIVLAALVPSSAMFLAPMFMQQDVPPPVKTPIVVTPPVDSTPPVILEWDRSIDMTIEPPPSE